MHTHIHTHIHMCIRMCVCVCVYIYIYVYVLNSHSFKPRVSDPISRCMNMRYIMDNPYLFSGDVCMQGFRAPGSGKTFKPQTLDWHTILELVLFRHPWSAVAHMCAAFVRCTCLRNMEHVSKPVHHRCNYPNGRDLCACTRAWYRCR